jgi:hypothetical protein
MNYNFVLVEIKDVKNVKNSENSHGDTCVYTQNKSEWPGMCGACKYAGEPGTSGYQEIPIQQGSPEIPQEYIQQLSFLGCLW